MRPNFATNSVLFEHSYRLVQICSQEAQNIQINEYFCMYRQHRGKFKTGQTGKIYVQIDMAYVHGFIELKLSR